MRTQEEIDEQLNKAQDHAEQGIRAWPAMSYEEGVATALLWVTEQSDDGPMEDK